ncbi:MAG: hypothetical protein HWE15_04705 [Algoriphagus sp.]|uniref:hypothetical protein n=1 Tax=Algoriphagus sp. TaxID=1872435 RepID=UPI001822352B|nr:hypothetical protein [Algoriphagus sp.]NVJ85581.1 hypothetical protein [Algoriphagus sp.]
MATQKEVRPTNPLNNWGTVLILTMTLGLAPFFPEPHFFGKVRWVMGGAVGMKLIDWGDLVFHGFPWVLLVRLSIISIRKKFAKA